MRHTRACVFGECTMKVQNGYRQKKNIFKIKEAVQINSRLNEFGSP